MTDNFNYKLLFVLLAWFGCFPMMSAQTVADTVTAPSPVVVKLVTFFPGGEPFSVFGHTEIRVTQGKEDYYFNYGVFDFNTPGFVYRFVQGDAEYMCAALPAQYATLGMEGRRMVEQELNLTPEQAVRIRDYLVDNSMPGHNTYIYQYLGDNCSTRPRDIIEMAVGDALCYRPKTDFVTYRDMMSHYTANYPWEQFGIDLVLGAGLDRPLDVRQRMFIPMALMHALDSATVVRYGNDQPVPLVRATQVMVDVPEDAAVQPPTPAWRSPLAVALLLLVVTSAMTWRDMSRRQVTRWFDTLVFGVYALVGCVLFFLMFCSVREATYPNYNAFWANPFMLIPAVGVWLASMRRLLRAYHGVNLAVIVLLGVAWHWLPQVANIAFFPLMVIPALRSASWLFCDRA